MNLIRLELNRIGHVELSFVNARVLRRVLRTVIANGGPADRTAYVQQDTDVAMLADNLPARARRDFEAGWEIRVKMDGWETAHHYGYDAHTVFETA